ncbi:MAG: hypothetical protein N3A38_09165 [Planctomycetota bacterium]|nr:hypothetical protein [Planctomycetota bacterium]
MAGRLSDRTVVLGVSGGIAAYKACELARLLVREGASVYVVMTENATRFVAPLSFEAITGRPCRTDMFGGASSGGDPYPHLDRSGELDALVIAPATANIIARMAAGIADDLLSTLALSVTCPVFVCPAMNHRMYRHPATSRNIGTLRSFGHRILGPEEGELACGESGAGRMLEPARILEAIVAELVARPRAGNRPGG